MAALRVAAVLLLAVGVALAAPDTEERVTYEGSKVFRITPETQTQLNTLMGLRNSMTVSLGLDWWIYPSRVGQHADLRVPAKMISFVESFLEKTDMTYSVMIDDVQTLVDMQMQGAASNSNPNDFDFTQYHKVADINAWLQTLPSKYPALATVFQIATSYEKRAMYAIKISSTKNANATKQAFWFDGGIHAREWIAPAAVVYMLNQLLEQYGKDATTTKLIDNIDVYVLPVFNPDGYEYTWTKDRMWRKTRSNTGHVCIGVDPNRNWDFHWNDGGSSTNPCDDAYCGPKAFSEIEVSTVAAYIKNVSTINGYINFHSYAQLWMSPWGYTATLPRDYTAQMELSKEAVTALQAVHGTKYGYGPIYTTIYPASGSSVDWTYAVANVVFSYGVELRDTGEYGFLLPAAEIVPTGEQTLAAVKAAMQYVIDHPRM